MCDNCNPKGHVNRNIIVCIDDTLKFGGKNTNVAELLAKIDQREQCTFHASWVDIIPDTPFPTSFFHHIDSEEIVKKAYRWLTQTYKDGDQIYFFGFSRGAYVVCILAEMIYEVGLIKEVTERQIRAAYHRHYGIRFGRLEARSVAKRFKDTFSWQDARVHFVGVWDVVFPSGLRSSRLATHTCHLRHALALDERWIKFRPVYFHQMNSPSTYKSSSSTIKEVWFAGSHSDVGGRNRAGKSHHAGNVSLQWMRREAAACGLKLKPTDLVWDLSDLELGMTLTRRGMVDSRVPELSQLRRIIPGQKIHASILYANSYIPTATLGGGFDIPTAQPGHELAEIHKDLWETGFFDDTAAEELLNHLDSRQGDPLVLFDRLLFMLRFEEGKECVRNVPGWQNKIMKFIEEGNCVPLVRLVTIVAFHEASCALGTHLDKCEPFPERLSHDIFVDAEACLKEILATHKHQDGPRVLTLLRPLTKHQHLRQRILTNQTLEAFMTLLDAIIKQPTGHFGKAMDGLNSLLQCEDTWAFLIGKLGETPEGFKGSRLVEILKVDDSDLLSTALRMMLTIARIPDASDVCFPVMPRITELAGRRHRLVGRLAIEIWLSLYNRDEQLSLNVRDANIRANVASVVLAHLGVDRRGSADDQGRTVGPGQTILSLLFGFDADSLSATQVRLIKELTLFVEKGNARERTTATLIILKLCEAKVIRSFLCEIHLLECFVEQLQRRDSALLAAYALTICLKYTDMKGPILDNDDLPTCIVAMLGLNYFDDAVGQVEGFQIFREFMQHAELRKRMENYKIAEVLDMKLCRGEPKEIRTSLLCLEIFQSFDPDGSWIEELVGSSLERLANTVWKVQEAGVMIFSALVQTERGVAAISPRIHEIVEMLLLGGNAIPVTGTSVVNPNSADNIQAQGNGSSPMALSGSSSSILGPVCALRVLVKNETLRVRVREIPQYATLKHLDLSGVGDTSLWRRWTSNQIDVTKMLDELIKVVDGELPEGHMSIWGPVLPFVVHWEYFALAPLMVISFAIGLPITIAILPIAIPIAGFTAWRFRKLDEDEGFRADDAERPMMMDDGSVFFEVNHDDAAVSFTCPASRG